MNEKKPFKPGEQEQKQPKYEPEIKYSNQDFDVYQGNYEKRDSRDETDFLQMIRGTEDEDQ